MKTFLGKAAGIAVVAAGIVGIVASLAGMFAVSQFVDAAQIVVIGGLDVIDETLVTTGDGLRAAASSVGSAQESVDAIVATTAGLGRTIGDSAPALGALSDVVSIDVPDALSSARDALAAAVDGAEVLDGAMRLVRSIPFLGNDNPVRESSGLAGGLKDLGGSLATLPERIGEMKGVLATTTENLKSAQENVAEVAASIAGLAPSLREVQTTLEKYQRLVERLQARTGLARAWLPRIARIVKWGGSLGLLWFAVVQIAVITQGWELYQRARVASGSRPADAAGG
jgi:hypothetical protein